jgi:hypothetical protein
MSLLSPTIKKFSDNCKLDVSNPRAILNRFLTLQVNATSWEHTYNHATKNDGGKTLSRFKYDSKAGIVDAYTRLENCHKFKASLWKELFQGATISKELIQDKCVKQKLSAFYDFVSKIVDPIDSKMTMGNKLMLFFLINTKQKNLRSLIYDSELGLGLNKGQQNTLYARMSEYTLKEDSDMNLAREIGTLISNMKLPAGDEHSKLHIDLRMPLSEMPIVPKQAKPAVRTRGNKVVFNIKPSRAEGWNAARELVLGENAAVKGCKEKMKLRFAPNKDLARQLIFSVVSSNPKHWAQVPTIKNGNLALAKKVRDSASEISTDDWAGLLKVVGYGDTRYAAKTEDCVAFFQHLAKAIPQSKRKHWSSKDLIQMFVTAHLPNWQQQWKANWTLNPIIERAVQRYISEQPVPSDEFIKVLAEGI